MEPDCYIIHKVNRYTKPNKHSFQCDYYKKWIVYADDVFKVNSNYRYKISKTEDDVRGATLCNIFEPMGEFGVYNVTFNDTHCSFQTEKEPVNIYLRKYSSLNR